MNSNDQSQILTNPPINHKPAGPISLRLAIEDLDILLEDASKTCRRNMVREKGVKTYDWAIKKKVCGDENMLS